MTKLDTRATKTPRTKPAEVRLDELMNAAERLFLDKGVESTTINEIVEAAQVAKGTFYHYFSSKNEILEALGKRYTDQFLVSLETAVGACAEGDWLGRLRAWIYASVVTYVDTFHIHDIVYANHHHHDRSNQAKNAILDQLQGIIEGGTVAGLWAPENPRVVALLIYSGVHGATDDVIATRANDCTAFAQTVTESCLHMLGVFPENSSASLKQSGKVR
ncbi:TetR/AcrR family transcriptional regulator [Thiorhodococcus drewsii]|uniref:TetR/AcrR family transcriptional regulator n=1 Tax=Thiorhodococcus drewsii TaxID=210408 RepID=UPI001C1E265C|nr:TetR/AcrR family transcriptional regulator [Thiorhodococcus drewsii]